MAQARKEKMEVVSVWQVEYVSRGFSLTQPRRHWAGRQGNTEEYRDGTEPQSHKSARGPEGKQKDTASMEDSWLDYILPEIRKSN